MREYLACCSAISVLVAQTRGRRMTAEEVERAKTLMIERERLSRLLWPQARA